MTWDENIDILRANSSHDGAVMLRRKDIKFHNLDVVGPWMVKCTNGDAPSVCWKAMRENIVISAGHRDTSDSYNVSAFLHCENDSESHKRVISFLLENNLILKTKKGLFYNIHFKWYDSNINFSPKIALSDFVNLRTGELIC